MMQQWRRFLPIVASAPALVIANPGHAIPQHKPQFWIARNRAPSAHDVFGMRSRCRPFLFCMDDPNATPQFPSQPDFHNDQGPLDHPEEEEVPTPPGSPPVANGALQPTPGSPAAPLLSPSRPPPGTPAAPAPFRNYEPPNPPKHAMSLAEFYEKIREQNETANNAAKPDAQLTPE